MNTVRVMIEKLVFGGQGLGRCNDKVVFVWNALPGEDVTVRITKKKKNFLEGMATEIHTPSPSRIVPEESHAASCSPWQILSAADEANWKLQLSKDAYYKLQQFEHIQQLELVDAPNYYSYRNKIEYSFTHTLEGELCFAFFERGSHWRTPIHPCVLASKEINETAEAILSWLQALGVSDRSTKSLYVLSNERGETIAGMFVRDENFPATHIPSFPNCVGFSLYYSNPKSPAAVPTKLLFQAGPTTIVSRVLNTPLQHDLLGFFQVNIPVFERAVQAIQPWVEQDTELLDCYGGVGAISLALHSSVQQGLIIDSNVEAIAAANHNIKQLQLSNFTAQCIATEHILDAIQPDQTVIVDPPRAGLHIDVINRLLAIKPKRLIYLSCNLSTQARDAELLLAAYQLKQAKVFNFFPRTPHIEGLLVFDRIGYN